ncbi:TPA: hypothetical protein U7D87_001242 [Streptococcus agalactiae]|nr:hypothetical protein [Streptococcus agalactiae]EPU76746.1 hypothetical protein SAG0312_05960 [Streptococcus agalactiae GB00115]EPU94191.1 hypothetical protein SAG0322_00215 [Streptococcus agalactiae GB00264]EPU95358.1 hypothetical protein SAG0323_02430 [Streptococcus agalactiae GB00279]EPV12043.1 hypothetical protein SAG0330_04545 [Streptococcus agalactiae GB00561]MCC9914406.1 hypothetical protein [Streptococcus agalactiae]
MKKLLKKLFVKKNRKIDVRPAWKIETHGWEANARRYDNMIEHNRGRTC